MPATTNFFNSKSRLDVKNAKPGFTQRWYVAPRRWFTTLQAVAAATYGGDAKTIATAHVFAAAGVNKEPGGGFIQMYAEPNGSQVASTSTGSAGTLVTPWKGTTFLIGDDPALEQLLETIKNDDLIILMEDANDPTLPLTQFGSDGLEAHFTKCDFVSGTTNSGKKGWNIEFESITRFFYAATVTVMP